MEYLKFSWIDYLLFGILLIGSSLVGIYFGFIRKKEDTFSHYVFGGKNMSVFPVTLSLVASSLSSLTLIGLPAEIYLYGMQYWMMWISWIIMGVITNYAFLPVFYKLQLTTTYEYLEVRFDKRIRKLASAMYVLTVITSLPVYVYGPSLAFNQVSGFNIHLTAFIISCTCIFYTSIGGLKAVVWADAFQFGCTLCTLGSILIIGTIEVGGVSNIWKKATIGQRMELFNMDPDPTVRSTFWSIVIGHIVVWLNLTGINPTAVQRFLSVPTYKDSKKVLVGLVLLSIITKSLGCFSGLVIYAKYSDCDPIKSAKIKTADQIMPYFVMDVASHFPGLSGVFVSGLLSTALSTLSTSLNTVSATIYKDFVSPFLPMQKESTANTIMKCLSAAVGITVVLLVFVMEHLGTIVQMALSLNGAFTGALLALFILGMLFPIATTKAVLCGTIVSLLVMITLVVPSQILIWHGTMKNAAKPLYTYGCNTSMPIELENNGLQAVPFWLYRISFYFYGPIGMFISVTIALLISWIAKSNDSVLVSKNLFSPCIHRFLKGYHFEEQNERELSCLNKNGKECTQSLLKL